MNEYRHVCFKDLENYFKKSDYFGNLTVKEKELIRDNLEVASSDRMKISGTYNDIQKLVLNSALKPNCTYIVTDFQTIYQTESGKVWGLDEEPSTVYSLVLNPLSTNQFSQNVELLENGIAKKWIVRYDFTQEVINGVPTKGKIIYLQDENNNSAYYDFKNIKFEVKLDSYDLASLQNGGIYNLYTFSKYENGAFIENSSQAFNNQFDFDCYQNVFLGSTKNNHFYGGFKKNVFTNSCEYNKFEWNTFNNKFTGIIMYTKGSVQNAIISTTEYSSAITKEFKMVQNQTSADPIFVVTIFDGDTLTTQIKVLNKK